MRPAFSKRLRSLRGNFAPARVVALERFVRTHRPAVLRRRRGCAGDRARAGAQRAYGDLHPSPSRWRVLLARGSRRSGSRPALGAPRRSSSWGLPAGGLAEFVTKGYIRVGTTLGFFAASGT